MSHHINFATISWEQFEDICLSLWFDEGYKDIQPMGRRREQGRDAIFTDSKTGRLTIFQFKCWVKQYETSKLKSMIKDACKKIASYGPERFILNSAQEPNATINDWLPELENELGFSIDYHDRSWIDLRLDNRRQDLRHDYFGLDLNHHTWASLKSQCLRQITQTVDSLSFQYASAVYINRKAEVFFTRFTESNKSGLIIVGRSGRGKTNLLCRLATTLLEQEKVVIFIRCSQTLADDDGLITLVNRALGYDARNHQAHLRDVTQLLKEQEENCYILIDGLSEIDDATRTNRSLINLFTFLTGLGRFKICVTCRDTVWPLIRYGLPSKYFFAESPDSDKIETILDDFNDAELDLALSCYCNIHNLAFTPVLTAREQLKHPLLLRLFCEAHKNESLGQISAVPVAQTFELYLGIKTHSIISRIKGKYSEHTIRKFLVILVGQMWQCGDAKFLTDEQWGNFDPNITLSEKDELLRLMAEEGLINVWQKPHTSSQALQFVFSELHEYLLLRYLLTLLPDIVYKGEDITKIGFEAIRYFRARTEEDPIRFRLLSLIGMLLPGIPEREKFLKSLLEWDFYTFCSSLAHIPPTGSLGLCKHKSLFTLAKELQFWYQIISSKILPSEIQTSLNARSSSKNRMVAIELIASPGCKEISYTYTQQEDYEANKNSIRVKQTSSYPTFQISIGTEHERIQLHNPDGGIIIPTWRSDGFIKRTINASFPPQYIGESFNVPERMALYDVLDELTDVINKLDTRLPQLPTILSKELVGLEKKQEIKSINMDDTELSQYLLEVFGQGLNSYQLIVNRYFPHIQNSLSFAVQIPCDLLFVTDRVSVRYAIIPSDRADNEIKFYYRVVGNDFHLADPKWNITIHDTGDNGSPVLLTDHVWGLLENKKKKRPPIHPIDIVEPMENFFSDKPINDLVTRWLLSDIRLLFGF